MLDASKLPCGVVGYCREAIQNFSDGLFTNLTTSIPYNLNKNYGNGFNDKKLLSQYLLEIEKDFESFKSKMAYDSLLFVNIGDSTNELMKSHYVAEIISKYFNFIQEIIWVKSISIPVKGRKVLARLPDGTIGEVIIEQDYITPGHYTPVSSDSKFHPCHEYIFVFSPNPRMKFDRLAIGVPFEDKNNIGRYADRDLKSRGDVWFIPYKTTGQKLKKNHPAPFPLALPEMCIKASPEGPVLDPYAGLMTTGVAAHKIGRPFVCIEQNENFIYGGIEKYPELSNLKVYKK